MQAAIAPRGEERTFLTHFVGGGLDDDDRYVVETFRSLANGDIVPVHADGTRRWCIGTDRQRSQPRGYSPTKCRHAMQDVAREHRVRRAAAGKSEREADAR